jgi:hypothetical protein
MRYTARLRVPRNAVMCPKNVFIEVPLSSYFNEQAISMLFSRVIPQHITDAGFFINDAAHHKQKIR